MSKIEAPSNIKLKKTFTYNDAKTAAFKSPKKYNEYSEMFEKFKRQVDDGKRPYIPKSLSLKSYEYSYVKKFLDLNNISIGDLIKFFFYQDSTFPDEALAVMMNQKVSLVFMNMKVDSWCYDQRLIERPDGVLVDADTLDKSFHEFKYNSSDSRATFSYNLHPFQSFLIDKHIDKSDYSNISSFIKSKFLEYGIYPAGLADIISKSTSKKSTRKVVGRSKNAGGTLSLSISSYEDELFLNFIEFTKQFSATVSNKSRIIKYVLVENGIIDDMHKYPIERARSDLAAIRAGGFNASKNYLTGSDEDRTILHDEIDRFKSYNATKSYLSISFTNSDYEKVKKYLDGLNEDPKCGVRKMMDAHGKKGKIFFTDLVRHLVFRSFGVYPNEIVEGLCVVAPK